MTTAALRFSADEVRLACECVYRAMPATPQYAWPRLRERLGMTVWVKHDNHTPTGAFKVRGGLTYIEHLRRTQPMVQGVITATRGNHGQSVAFAAARNGIQATVVVPQGNSVEKNAAMRALGARLVEHGEDFQAAREHAAQLASQHALHMLPSFHRELVLGVMTGWVEFFGSFARGDEPDAVFVPIGLGSGFCAAAAARAFTGARSRLIGVVSAHATAYLDSFRARRAIEAPANTVLADGMACRMPDAQALEIIWHEADDVVAVSDEAVAQAMRILFADTHNVAEGAGAASLAAAIAQRERIAGLARAPGRGHQGLTVGVTLCGGNVDTDLFARVLAGERFGRSGD